MTKEWKDGLPPVGLEVNLLICDGIISKGKVTAIGEELFIFKHDGFKHESHYLIKKCKFAPIKSKQEIEREEAIAEMFRLANDYPFEHKQIVDTITAHAVARIYDAGYRNNGEEIDRVQLSTFISRVSALEYLQDELLKHFKIYPRSKR